MKQQIAILFGFVVIAASLGAPALAHEPWFNNYDHNHDGRWTYEEFRRAHYDWIRQHHEAERIQEAELRHRFEVLSRDHHGWVTPVEVRNFHAW